MKYFIAFLLLVFIPCIIIAEVSFPQSMYTAPRQWKKIEFFEDDKMSFKSELDAGYSAESFTQNYSGTYTLRQDEPFVYLDVATTKNEEYSFVVLWTKDSLIITDIKTKETVFFTGTKYYKFPLDLEPQLRVFTRCYSDRNLSESYGGNDYNYEAKNLLDYELTNPWVEGVDGPGLGEKIQFFNVEETSAISIVNGYFDPQRPDLFYANNRLKEVVLRVFSSKNYREKLYEINWELEDTNNIQTMIIPKYAQYFEVEIKAVYPGTKYNDTCVSGLFTHVGLGFGEGNREGDAYSIVSKLDS